MDYQQPDFYHFDEDSIALAKYVIANFKNLPPPVKMGDFFCGCGVIGLEIIDHGVLPGEIIFIEKNSKFLNYITQNIFNFEVSKNIQSRIFNKNIFDVVEKDFDLIVANPPYFYPNKNRKSSNIDKYQARFFDDYNFVDVIEKVLMSLSVSGKAYILFRFNEVSSDLPHIENLISLKNFQYHIDKDFLPKTSLLMIF